MELTMFALQRDGLKIGNSLPLAERRNLVVEAAAKAAGATEITYELTVAALPGVRTAGPSVRTLPADQAVPGGFVALATIWTDLAHPRNVIHVDVPAD